MDEHTRKLKQKVKEVRETYEAEVEDERKKGHKLAKEEAARAEDRRNTEIDRLQNELSKMKAALDAELLKANASGEARVQDTERRFAVELKQREAELKLE